MRRKLSANPWKMNAICKAESHFFLLLSIQSQISSSNEIARFHNSRLVFSTSFKSIPIAVSLDLIYRGMCDASWSKFECLLLTS